jgi:hypothetical protein
MRGLEQVRAEFRVTAVADHLWRVLHSVGLARLRAAFGGVLRVGERAALAGFQETIAPDSGTETKKRSEAVRESGQSLRGAF